MSETRTLRVVIVGNSKAAQRAIADLGGSTKKAGRDFDGFAGGMAKKFVALGAAIGATQIAKKIYDVGASYEQNMNLIKNLDPTVNIKDTDKALQAQAGSLAKLGLSTVQGSEGLRELIKAGRTTKEALAALNGTMTLATAGQLSAADAAAIVANNLNAFGLGAGDAGKLANVLANAANASSADVSDLGQALSQSSAVAHMAGLSFEQTTGYIAALSNVGIQGSDAGTSLKTMFMRLTGAVPEANKALKGVGVSIADAKGHIKPVATVLGELQGKLSKLSDAKKNEALGKIFGSDSIRAASAILPKLGSQMDTLQKNITKTGGASSAASAQTAGFSGVLKEMKARGETAMQGLYSKAAPTLEKLGRKMLEMGPKVQAGIGPALGKVKQAFAGFASGGMGNALSKTFQALGTFGKAMLPTLKEIGGQIMSVVGPAFKEIGQLISQKLLPAFQAFLPAITPVAKFLLKLFGGAVVGVIKGLVMMIKGAINIISGVIQVFTALLTGNWSLAWEGVKNILLGVVQFIWGRIEWLWNMGILGAFKKGFKFVIDLVKNGWQFVKNSFSGNIGALGNLMLRVIKFITTPYRLAFQGARSLITGAWNAIKGLFSGGVGGIRGILSKIIQIITWPYRQAFSLARSAISGGWNVVKGLFSGGINTVKGLIGKVPGLIKGAFGKAFDLLKNVGHDIIAGLLQGIQNQFSSVQHMVEHVANLIPGPIKKILGIHSPSRVFAQIGEYIIAGLTQGLKRGAAGITAVMASLSKQVMVAFAGGRINGKQKNALLGLIESEGKKLKAAAAKRAKIADALKESNARLAAASKALETLKAAKSDLAEKIGSNITSGAGFKDNAEGPEGSSIQAILSRMRAKLQAATKFRDNLQALAKKGLMPSILGQLAEMGPETGGMVAAELLRGSAGQLAELNSLQSQTEKLAGSAGNFIAGEIYDPQIKAAEAKIVTEQKINHNLVITLKNIDAKDAALAKLIAAEVRNEIARLNRINGKKK